MSAHVDGYRAGFQGRALPAGACPRGWQIGRARAQANTIAGGEASAAARSDGEPAAVPARPVGARHFSGALSAGLKVAVTEQCDARGLGRGGLAPARPFAGLPAEGEPVEVYEAIRLPLGGLR